MKTSILAITLVAASAALSGCCLFKSSTPPPDIAPAETAPAR